MREMECPTPIARLYARALYFQVIVAAFLFLELRLKVCNKLLSRLSYRAGAHFLINGLPGRARLELSVKPALKA